jgi:hypothetical protein
MTNVPPALEPASTVLIFGPHALSLSQGSFARPRNQLQEPDYQRLSNTVRGLSGFWTDISRDVPILGPFEGQTLLGKLPTGLQTGDLGELQFPLPNVLPLPLVVVTRLTQHLAFVKAEMLDLADTKSLPSELLKRIEVLGLCTGKLAGIAANCSSNIAQLRNHGTNAIRLAMLAGALTDDEQASSDWEDSISLSVSWGSIETLASIDNLLYGFPQVLSALTIAINSENSSSGREEINENDKQAIGTQLGRKVEIKWPACRRSWLVRTRHWRHHQEGTEQLLRFCFVIATLSSSCPEYQIWHCLTGQEANMS